MDIYLKRLLWTLVFIIVFFAWVFLSVGNELNAGREGFKVIKMVLDGTGYADCNREKVVNIFNKYLGEDFEEWGDVLKRHGYKVVFKAKNVLIIENEGRIVQIENKYPFVKTPPDEKIMNLLETIKEL